MVKVLINPLIIFIILSLLAVGFSFKKNRWSNIIWMIAATWFLLISSTPIPRWLVSNLESKYAVFDFNEHNKNDNCHIIVLGGGHTEDPRLPVNNQLSRVALGRLVEGTRIYGFYERSKLIFSGHSNKRKMSQAEMLARASLILKVDQADTLLSPKPRNTEQEAEFYLDRFGNKHCFVLVTDAIHMPRAMMWFSNYGLTPIPAPTNYLVKIDPNKKRIWFKPSLSNIEMMSMAMVEYIGILYYWIQQF